MAIRSLVLYPDPILLTPTEPVSEVDDTVRELVRDMTETMYFAAGIGLAANQVGSSMRVCLIDESAGRDPESLLVLINPTVLEAVGDLEEAEEGCLSFPDINLQIKRSLGVTVSAMGLDGEAFTLDVEGLMGRVLLHECEHLDGFTFLRNISPLKRELMKRQIRKRIEKGTWTGPSLP
jgi:peptide deformylase